MVVQWYEFYVLYYCMNRKHSPQFVYINIYMYTCKNFICCVAVSLRACSQLLTFADNTSIGGLPYPALRCVLVHQVRGTATILLFSCAMLLYTTGILVRGQHSGFPLCESVLCDQVSPIFLFPLGPRICHRANPYLRYCFNLPVFLWHMVVALKLLGWFHQKLA